jgi:hypothetical protein
MSQAEFNRVLTAGTYLLSVFIEDTHDNNMTIVSSILHRRKQSSLGCCVRGVVGYGCNICTIGISSRAMMSSVVHYHSLIPFCCC